MGNAQLRSRLHTLCVLYARLYIFIENSASSARWGFCEKAMFWWIGVFCVVHKRDYYDHKQKKITAYCGVVLMFMCISTHRLTSNRLCDPISFHPIPLSTICRCVLVCRLFVLILRMLKFCILRSLSLSLACCLNCSHSTRRLANKLYGVLEIRCFGEGRWNEKVNAGEPNSHRFGWVKRQTTECDPFNVRPKSRPQKKWDREWLYYENWVTRIMPS